MINLEGKTIIINGGLGLLGSGFSIHCAASKANVVIVDLNKDIAIDIIETMKIKTGNTHIIYKNCDITDEQVFLI